MIGNKTNRHQMQKIYLCGFSQDVGISYIWYHLLDIHVVFQEMHFFPGVKLSKNGIHKALQGIGVVVLPHRKLTSVTQKSHVAGFASKMRDDSKNVTKSSENTVVSFKERLYAAAAATTTKKKTCSILHDFLESNPTSAHSPKKKALPHYRWLVWHSAYQWRPGSKETVDFSSSSVASNLVTSPDVWCRSFSEWFDFLKSGNLKFW